VTCRQRAHRAQAASSPDDPPETPCDQDITRINSTAPESEEIRLRKVEAAARGFDLGPGDVSVLENCRLIMRRRADAPPLELPPAPLQRTMWEQILDQRK
jgi:hypothetical protein